MCLITYKMTICSKCKCKIAIPINKIPGKEIEPLCVECMMRKKIERRNRG